MKDRELFSIPESSRESGLYSLRPEELIRPFNNPDRVKIQYHSLRQTPRDFLDLLFFSTNLGFWYRYIEIMVRGRSLALRGEFTDEKFAQFSARFISVLESFGGIFHITGLENLLEEEGAVVFAGNHMSVLETFVLPAIIVPQKKLTFVVKNSLVTNPLFGAIMQSRNPIALRRTNPREDFQKVMEEGRERLASGVSVAIFPQATRDPVLKKSEFNSIATKLAKKEKVPIHPIALKTDFWLPGGMIKDLGVLNRDRKIHIAIGEAIQPEVDAKKTQERILGFIADHLRYWGGEVVV